jgi:hypothetical protein
MLRHRTGAFHEIDFETWNNDNLPMSKPSKAAAKKPARARGSKTWGTRAAAAIRARCNKWTRAEREAWLERAMQIAYGSDAQAPKTRRR